MVAVSITTYAVVTSQPGAQKIEVAAVTPDDPGSLADDQVDGPFTAPAEINA